MTETSDILFQCPKCNGPHFNISHGGLLVCASVSKFTDFKPKQGGCGWTGTTRSLVLIWTSPSPPNNQCHYNHTKAETPFGTFLLTWKGWKERPEYGFDRTPWGEAEYHGWDTMEEAKQWAAEEMVRRIGRCFEKK